MRKMTFALCFANRGFFPGESIADARKELIKVVTENGYDYIVMGENLTRYGAVETRQEGQLYADFLRANVGKYDGIILSLPNFGDENGISVAFKDVDVPVLVQAYPDEESLMDFAHRRDALCGKLAMCNVLRQLHIKYTLTKQFTVKPDSKEFAEDLRLFAGTCRVVGGMKQINVGAFGARTTAFKTVRFDEIAFANRRVNIETIDLAEVFAIMDTLTEQDIVAKKARLTELADFGSYPREKLDNIAKLAVTVYRYVENLNLHAVAIRCWDELEKRYGIAPCLVLGELNERGIYAACELDVNNAVMMRAIGLASDYPVMLLDVNNNYGQSEDKVIMFHCGPAPISMMQGKGTIKEHLMFRKSYGEGSGVGINVGKLYVGDVTVGSFKTEDGKLCSFVTEGKLTDDHIEEEFFGCGTVFQKKGANQMLDYMARNGYRHHVAITKGNWAQSVKEAFENYLGYEIDLL